MIKSSGIIFGIYYLLNAGNNYVQSINQSELPKNYRLSQYKIIKTLGKGGFGITYLALDEKANKPVVVKEYFPKSLVFRATNYTDISLLDSSVHNDYKAGLHRFEREAIALSQFNHPNITKVLTFFKQNNTAYFVMDYIEGKSLKTFQKDKGRALTESEIISDVLPVLDGLLAVHNKGMLHLDIKPDNILQTRFGKPILIDFGGAKFISSQESQDLSHSSMLATDGYAPVEQYSKHRKQMPSTDLYAFGMTLYSLISPNETLPKSTDRQINLFEDLPDPLKNIRETAKGYSEELYQAIEKCTAIKMTDRVQTVVELKEILHPLLNGKVNQKLLEKKEDIIIENPTNNIITNAIKQENVPQNKKWSNKKKAIVLGGGLLFIIFAVSLFSRITKESTSVVTTENTSSVNENDPVYQYNKGKEYWNKKLYKEAVEWYTKSANQGNADAQINLGYMYENGYGVDKSYDKAVELYEKSAIQGNSYAQNNLGYMYENGYGVDKSYDKAVELYKKSAIQGNSYAQNNLGYMYENGYGVSKNYDKALELYNKAAKDGNATAQENLGILQNKLGEIDFEKKSYGTAFEWYKKAAEQGNAKAQNNLGHMYLDGHGVNSSPKDAFKWYKKAAKQGNVKAQNRLGYMYLSGNGVAQSYKDAFVWLEKAAKQGNIEAQNTLGHMYLNGSGIAQSYKDAFVWLEKAAKQGNSDSQLHLGNMYFDGNGAPQSYKNALIWYEKTKHKLDAKRQKELGDLYANKDKGKEEVPKSYVNAIKWYKKSVAQGNTDAEEEIKLIRRLDISRIRTIQDFINKYNCGSIKSDGKWGNNTESGLKRLVHYNKSIFGNTSAEPTTDVFDLLINNMERINSCQ